MDIPEDLIQACKRGDPAGFTELVGLTHKQVYALCLRITGNPDDAAEASQETYLRLLRTIRGFRGEAQFSTWLYRVTSSVAIGILRKKMRRDPEVVLETEVLAEVTVDVAPDPAEQAENKEMSRRLDQALMALPAGYRAVVVMKDVYGFSLAEVGEQLGISEGAAKVRLFRARQQLREMLYDVGNDRKTG